MGRLILARHGESEFNAANLFTGWSDPTLTERGWAQARAIGEALRTAGISPDQIFSSGLQRARSTARIAVEVLGTDVPVHPDLALNERDYGELTGLNKAETEARYGRAELRCWRRGYADAPPGGESLRDVAARAVPYVLRHILPPLLRGETVLVVSHGNTLRALVMALEGISPLDIQDVEIKTGEMIDYDVSADAIFTRLNSLYVAPKEA